jgi:hypothetical protein
MIRIPIPVFRDDSVYDKISITRPKVGVLADTRRIAEGGDSYSAMHAFLSGCTEAIEKTDGQVITEKASIKNILRSIPFRSAEYAAIQIILLVDPDDGVEGYTAARCAVKASFLNLSKKTERSKSIRAISYRACRLRSWMSTNVLSGTISIRPSK